MKSLFIKTVFLSFCLCSMSAVLQAAPPSVSSVIETDRGAMVETSAMSVSIRDGVVVGLENKFTQEAYIDSRANVDELQKNLPSGMGTQSTVGERERASELFEFPWGEHPVDALWVNQHHPSSKSRFDYTQLSPVSARLTYTGLTDGSITYEDESYSLEITIEANGDVAITPEANSPRSGVYGVNLTVAPLLPAITVEAPIFDGIRITPDMPQVLWNVLWGNYWDYAFVALNGWKHGSIGIWCPDAELKYSKSLYHMVNDEGLSLSFHGMNIPPFEKSTAASPVTWKIQAFENGWSEAVAHFRTWRNEHVKIAPRPDWAKEISFVNMGVNANKMWLKLLDGYFEGRNLERTLTFAAVIREEGFDKNHTNNRPYEGVKEDMQAWKTSGAKLMAYLNPVIMWSPDPQTDREHLGLKLAKEAATIPPFQPPENTSKSSVQHLGHPGWQRWFLDWIYEYVHEYDIDAIYHDEGQKTPLDNRGLVNGMTPSMGRADYHYKAQVQNPNSVHGTEHQTSVNNVGTSFSIGGGILWGTAPSGMRHQRIKNASPISSSLHHPHGVIRAFPHYSEFSTRGTPQLFHWGMDQMEKRAEIAGHSIQKSSLFSTQYVPFDQWVNELWIERTRATTFVWEGLRPYFPEVWEKDVLSYFLSSSGEDFRYVTYPWGTALVEVEGPTRERMIYARLHGTIYADIGPSGAIPGWPIYNVDGPAGLNPSTYYSFDPSAKRPSIYFKTDNNASTGLYEGYLKRGYVDEASAYLELEAIPEIGNITSWDQLVLVSDVEPIAIWINGKEQKISKRILSQTRVKGEDGKTLVEKTFAENEYQIKFRLPAKICVLLKQPADWKNVEETAFVRYVNGLGLERRPIFSDQFIQEGLSREVPKGNKTTLPFPLFLNNPDSRVHIPGARFDLSLPLALPEGATDGHMTIQVHSVGRPLLDSPQVNGLPVSAITDHTGKTASLMFTVPLNVSSPLALVQFEAEKKPIVSVTWKESSPESNMHEKQISKP